MSPIKTLTDDERRFFERAAIHMKDGKSLAEAARAVVADDARILAALTDAATGPALVDAFSRDVYAQIRGDNAAPRRDRAFGGMSQDALDYLNGRWSRRRNNR